MNESKPSKVSVIVVVHPEYLPYLPTALNSLKTQSLSHEIVLVANGCSIDGINGGDSGGGYESHNIKYIFSPACSLAVAANLGISEASGQYIVRVDSDDFVSSDALEKEAAILDEDFEIDCVWCDYIQADTLVKGDGFETFLLSQLPQMNLEHACGAMFRKSVWEELGGYDEELDYQEAFDFWCRFYDQGYQAKRLEIPLYLYRRGHASMSTNPQRDKVRKELEIKYDLCDS